MTDWCEGFSAQLRAILQGHSSSRAPLHGYVTCPSTQSCFCSFPPSAQSCFFPLPPSAQSCFCPLPPLDQGHSRINDLHAKLISKSASWKIQPETLTCPRAQRQMVGIHTQAGWHQSDSVSPLYSLPPLAITTSVPMSPTTTYISPLTSLTFH